MVFDVCIIGGGIVGLATGYKLLLQQPGLKLCIVEKEAAIAQHQTGHNSGVIHSGIYYKPGSAKALNCTNGYKQMVEFCQTNNIAHDICGKLIVATNEEEIPRLRELQDRGVANGLKQLALIQASEIKRYEPHAAGLAALYVPQAGITDYKLVAQKLAELIRGMGGTIELGFKVQQIKTQNGEKHIANRKQNIQAKVLVNCAGLYCDKIATMDGLEPGIQIIPFRGEYYELKDNKTELVRNLIYPVPDPEFPFLGVHFTRMIGGGVEAGPNAVLAFQREGYRKGQVNVGELAETLSYSGFLKIAQKHWRYGMGEMYRSYSKAAFVQSLQKLVPEVTEADVTYHGSGVRAQACDRDGKLLDDFYIKESEQSVHVLNAPSPAATASLAIGDTIAEKVATKLV